MTETERQAWLQLAFTPHIGAESFAVLLQMYGTAGAALQAPAEVIAQLGKHAKQAAREWHNTSLARAAADSSRFNNLLAAYRESPAVMRERLYLDTMAGIYAQSNKVLVDADDARPIINLGDAPALPAPLASESTAPAANIPPVPVVTPAAANGKTPASNNSRNDRSRSR